MGLQSELQQDIADAFDSDLDDAVTEFIGTRTITAVAHESYINKTAHTDKTERVDVWGEVNPNVKMSPLQAFASQAKQATTEQITHTYSGRGVFSGYTRYEVQDSTVEATDVKLIALQSEVTDMPKVDDLINGHRVIHVDKDPANVTYELQLRGV